MTEPSSLDFGSPASAEEPQVYVGIFPASHCQIREQLEDADRRLSELQSSSVPVTPVAQTHGHMAPLPEEDEIDGELNAADGSATPIKAGANSKRLSTASMASTGYAFASPDGRRLSNLLQLSPIRTEGPSGARPPPPLPSLKCGDETAAGAMEPLVDEVACALREWYSLLYTHLARRDYALFNNVRAQADELHAGRRALLAATLSGDEGVRLRSHIVDRLVRGNIMQGLDVIVRHPTSGGLVEVDDDVSNDMRPNDRRAWVTGVRMYAMQVALAYSTASNGPSAMGQPDHSMSSLAALPGGTATAAALAAPRTTAFTPMPGPTSAAATDATSSRFHHVYLDLRAFVGSLCAPGETAELSFSLFNKSDTRFVTEEFCVVLNQHGAPIAEERMGRARTLFIDLSTHDVQDAIFLVCRVVKNGSMKSAVAAPSSGSPSRESIQMSPTASASNDADTRSYVSAVIEDDTSASPNMVSTSRLGSRQSVRRPFGCAVLDISQLTKESPTSPVASTPAGNDDRSMPIFVPVSEAAFSTLHEDIIASRIKEFEKSPRADLVAVRVRVFHGDSAQAVVDQHPSLLTGAPLTQRLGFPDVVAPELVRSDVYIKLWSGEFGLGPLDGGSAGSRRMQQLTSGGPKNIEVSAEVRRRDGSVVQRAISRGTGEPKVSQ